MVSVYEIFASIQGESTYAGLPCTFVRLAGCNQDCNYCDTPAARSEGEQLTVEEILESVNQFGLPLVEVTGGEPLLQPECETLLQELCNAGYEVLLETNGSQRLPASRNYTVIMDIKCPSSGAALATCWENLHLLAAGDELKFVISDRRDFEWALDVVNKYEDDLHAKEVLFSPAHNTLSPAALSRWIMEEYPGGRLNRQIHKYIEMR